MPKLVTKSRRLSSMPKHILVVVDYIAPVEEVEILMERDRFWDPSIDSAPENIRNIFCQHNETTIMATFSDTVNTN